jgi:hypothetical protein
MDSVLHEMLRMRIFSQYCSVCVKSSCLYRILTHYLPSDNGEPEQREHFFLKLKRYLSTFNVFPSVPPTTDPYKLQNERISTGLFIILLTIILTILLLYTSLVTVTKTVNIKNPTLAQYSQLYVTYPQTLTCPCTTISINYEEFLHVKYSFHQVCNSIFVTENWIYYLDTAYGFKIFDYDDFRWTGPYTFQGLNAFCALVNRTISDSLIRFYSSQYVSAFVTPSELFRSQAQSLFLQFISTTTNAFLLSLSMIRGTIQGNALLSGLQTNYYLIVSNDSNTIFSLPLHYSDCNCDASPTCGYLSAMYNTRTQETLFIVPGIYTGCYIIESLFQSTLECFYDQTCISALQSYMVLSSTLNITALDSSLPTQYFINSTIEDLVDHLMVEQWNSSQMYDGYYNACQPAQCTYTHETKNDIIYIATTLIGLVGGLITVLKLVVPLLVKLIRRKTELPRQENGKIKTKVTGEYISGTSTYISLPGGMHNTQL